MRDPILSPDTLWAILPCTLESMIRACEGQPVVGADAPAYEAAHDAELPGSFNAGLVGNVAVLPVHGTIRPRPSFSFFDLFSRSTNLSALAHDLDVALNDAQVEAIVFDIDSPGGMVTGTSEFAGLVHEARGQKPIIAYASGMAASAAYWIASAADEVVINATAEAGSIGVVATIVDFREMDKKIGIQEIEIVNSRSPLKRVDPLTDRGRDLIQVRLDDIAAVFFDTVARNRGVDVDTVINEFGQGDLAVGDRAVRMGLADRVGSFDELLSELSVNSNRSEASMLNRSKAKPAAADGTGDEIETVEALEAEFPELVAAIRETARKDGYEAGHAEGVESGATAERERIQAIEAQSNPMIASYIAEVKYDPDATPQAVAVEALRRINAGEIDRSVVQAQDREDPVTDVDELDEDELAADIIKQAAAAANR